MLACQQDGQISYEEFEAVMNPGTDWGKASLDIRELMALIYSSLFWEVKQKHKEELHEALTHHELLQQFLGLEKRLDGQFWKVLELVGALEDPPLVASLLDIEGCFEEVKSFLCPGLAPGFVPWETLSALEEFDDDVFLKDSGIVNVDPIC
ncbi:hypothetical protein Tco_1186390 [Tanacetum coccineum]